jgi:hypothetical protein
MFSEGENWFDTLHAHLSAGTLHAPDTIAILGQTSLAFWEDASRIAHQLGILDPAVEEELTVLPGWDWMFIPKPKVRRWNINANAVEAFLAEHGQYPRRLPHQPKPALGIPEVRLHDWVRRQRRTWAELSSYQVARLEQIPGFSWEPLEEAWDRNAAAYTAFVEQHHRRPSIRAATGTVEHRLGVWVNNQRAAERHGRLPYHRIRELSDLPLWVWTRIPDEDIPCPGSGVRIGVAQTRVLDSLPSDLDRVARSRSAVRPQKGRIHEFTQRDHG